MQNVVFSTSENVQEEWDSIKPFFQPIVEVSSGRVTGYEALARYVNSNGEAVSAGHLFTDEGISTEDKRRLDRLVREKAVRRAHELPDQTRMTLNISPQWLTATTTDALPTLDMLHRHKVDPSRIVIELIELNGDLDSLCRAVKLYREAGVRIAIDDFGAGFSQIDRVIALEPDIIKLDMRLFQQGAQGGMAESAVESLVVFCAKSGAVIVCEGVETEEEFFFGLRCGARHMQGFLFSQATADFADCHAFSQQVAELRARFFAAQKEKAQKARASYQHLMQAVESIQQHHKMLDIVDVKFVSQSLRAINGVIRFYAADSTGEQLTVNYARPMEGDVWIEDARFKGYNWSWRAYFYQLFAGESRVLSQEYLDIETSTPCKTLSVQLNDNTILLIDVEASS